MYILGLISTQRMTHKKPRKVKFSIFKMAHVYTKVWSVTGWPIISNIILQKKIDTHQRQKSTLCTTGKVLIFWQDYMLVMNS